MTGDTPLRSAVRVLAARTRGMAGTRVERFAVELASRSGLSRLGVRWNAGRGAIYTFHSIVPDRAAHLNSDLRTTPAFLARLLASLRRADVDIMDMDDLLSRLESPGRRRFVVITLDDGYADNLHHALPVFEKHGAPVTIYVTADLVMRSLYCWWIGLERLFLQNDNVEIPSMSRRWSVRTQDEKALAYREACHWVSQDVEARARLLAPVFTRYGISTAAIAGEIGLSVDQLKTLGRHPLVRVGSHTHSHPELAKLREDDAGREIRASKRFLEALLEKPVEHLAYPFGWARACGRREAELAKAAGYKTAVTTRHGCVFDWHLREPHLLPRVGINRPYESVDLAWLQIDGFVAALQEFVRRPSCGSQPDDRAKA